MSFEFQIVLFDLDSQEKIRHLAEVTLQANGLRINAKEEKADFYSAIDNYDYAFSGWHIAPAPMENFDLSNENMRSPYPFPDEIKNFYAILREVGAEHGVGLWALGHHPFATLDDVLEADRWAREQAARSVANPVPSAPIG